jgi:hypothetical protein
MELEPGASRNPVPRWAVALVCLLLIATATVMTLASLSLAADGSYHLLQVLKSGDAFGLDARIVGAWARQGPVVVALRAGVTDTHVLTILFGAGQLLVPASAWSLAIVLSRTNGLACAAVTMTAGLCAGATWLFSALESVVAVPLTVLVGVLLWRPTAWRLRELALAVLASAILVASYETALVTGAMLACWAGWRATRARDAPEKYGCAAVAALSALSVAVAVAGTQLGTNRTNSQSLAYFVVSLQPWPFYLALVGIATVIAGLGPWLTALPRQLMLAAGCCALIVSVVAFDAGIVESFQARGGTAVAGVLLLAFLFWTWARADRNPPYRDGGRLASRLLVAVPVLFVAAVLATTVAPIRSWSSSLDAFRTEVGARQGVVVDVEAIPPGKRAVLWSWTSSSLSLIVRPRADAAVLVNRDPPIVPFPPREARAQLDDSYTWRS